MPMDSFFLLWNQNKKKKSGISLTWMTVSGFSERSHRIPSSVQNCVSGFSGTFTWCWCCTHGHRGTHQYGRHHTNIVFFFLLAWKNEMGLCNHITVHITTKWEYYQAGGKEFLIASLDVLSWEFVCVVGWPDVWICSCRFFFLFGIFDQLINGNMPIEIITDTSTVWSAWDKAVIVVCLLSDV